MSLMKFELDLVGLDQYCLRFGYVMSGMNSLRLLIIRLILPQVILLI